MEYFIKNPYVTTAYLDARYIQNIRLFRMRVCQLLLNPFHAIGLFLYLLKTSGGIERDQWHAKG